MCPLAEQRRVFLLLRHGVQKTNECPRCQLCVDEEQSVQRGAFLATRIDMMEHRNFHLLCDRDGDVNDFVALASERAGDEGREERPGGNRSVPMFCWVSPCWRR